MAEIRRSPVEVGSLSHDLQGLDIPGAGFINSSSGIMKRNPFGGGIKEAANVFIVILRFLRDVSEKRALI